MLCKRKNQLITNCIGVFILISSLISFLGCIQEELSDEDNSIAHSKGGKGEQVTDDNRFIIGVTNCEELGWSADHPNICALGDKMEAPNYPSPKEGKEVCLFIQTPKDKSIILPDNLAFDDLGGEIKPAFRLKNQDDSTETSYHNIVGQEGESADLDFASRFHKLCRIHVNLGKLDSGQYTVDTKYKYIETGECTEEEQHTGGYFNWNDPEEMTTGPETLKLSFEVVDD